MSQSYLLLISISTFLLTYRWRIPLCTDVPRGYCLPQTSDSQGYQLLVLQYYREINILGYDYIAFLNSVRFLLMPSGGIIQRLLGIPFFEPFLELLGSDFLQHNHKEKILQEGKGQKGIWKKLHRRNIPRRTIYRNFSKPNNMTAIHLSRIMVPYHIW